jgi:hypothetical protein
VSFTPRHPVRATPSSSSSIRLQSRVVTLLSCVQPEYRSRARRVVSAGVGARFRVVFPR